MAKPNGMPTAGCRRLQDIPLNDLGRVQAANAGGILAGLFARDGRSESSLAFIASPLGRARSTMELVRGAH